MQRKLDHPAPDGLARRRLLQQCAAGAVLGGLPLWAMASDDDTFDQDSMLKAATGFFGETTAGPAKVIEKAFREQGRPNRYLRGSEVSGALTVGLRYGIGGAGINDLHADGITLAPIRLGVGLRAGASVGYMHCRKEESLNPL